MELFHFKRDIPFMSYGKLTTFISLATFQPAKRHKLRQKVMAY